VPYSSNIYQMMKSADSQQQFDCWADDEPRDHSRLDNLSYKKSTFWNLSLASERLRCRCFVACSKDLDGWHLERWIRSSATSR
jgi:hypothetical protein